MSYTVKMPLLRVAHPSEDAQQKETAKIKAKFPETYNAIDIEDSLTRDISTKGVPRTNPQMFEFRNSNDPQLTPRRGWQ